MLKSELTDLPPAVIVVVRDVESKSGELYVGWSVCVGLFGWDDPV